jgi:hypothetical protein
MYYSLENIENYKLIKYENINTNWKYRRYLQNNSNNIMKYNNINIFQEIGNNPYMLINKQQTNNIPFLFNNIHQQNFPIINYPNTDLRKEYIKKQRFNTRLISPQININESYILKDL